MPELALNAIGVDIVLQTGLNLGNYAPTELAIHWKNSQGSGVWIGAIGDLAGDIKYTTESGDLNVDGKWIIQSSITSATLTSLGDAKHFTVVAPFT